MLTELITTGIAVFIVIVVVFFGWLILNDAIKEDGK